MLTSDRKPTGNMSWAVLFFFAATLGFNGCGDGNNAPPSASDGIASPTPEANAGPDQGGKAPGSLITLNGSASSDPTGAPLMYSWSLTAPAGSAAVLANASSVSPTFTVDLAGTYTAQLIVHNGTVRSAPDTVLITNGTTFRSTLASDNFNRADNLGASSAWDAGYTMKNPMAIVSQQVRPIATNPSDPKSVGSYHAVMPHNDQWCQITLGIWTGSEDREFGCILRAHAPPTTNWYWCYARANGPRNAAIVKHHGNGAGDVNLASNFSVIWAPGDKLRCEAQGTALRLYRIPNGTMDETRLLSTTDGEWTSGRTGILLWMETGGDLSHAAADDFAMGELATFDSATGATTTMTNVDPTLISATDFRTKASP